MPTLGRCVARVTFVLSAHVSVIVDLCARFCGSVCNENSSSWFDSHKCVSNYIFPMLALDRYDPATKIYLISSRLARGSSQVEIACTPWYPVECSVNEEDKLPPLKRMTFDWPLASWTVCHWPRATSLSQRSSSLAVQLSSFNEPLFLSLSPRGYPHSSYGQKTHPKKRDCRAVCLY